MRWRSVLLDASAKWTTEMGFLFRNVFRNWRRFVRLAFVFVNANSYFQWIIPNFSHLSRRFCSQGQNSSRDLFAIVEVEWQPAPSESCLCFNPETEQHVDVRNLISFPRITTELVDLHPVRLFAEMPRLLCRLVWQQHCHARAWPVQPEPITLVLHSLREG